MSTAKALLSALGVTVVSSVLLTIVRGIPTTGQLVGGGLGMFAIAFVVMKVYGGESPRTPNDKVT